MHNLNGLIDTRSASLRVISEIAAISLEGILSETSSASSQKQ